MTTTFKPIFYDDKRGRVSKQYQPASYQPSCLTEDALGAFVKGYQKKAVKRLETFCVESKRMDQKVEKVLQTLKDSGIIISNFQADKTSVEKVMNWRRRPKGINISLEGKRGDTPLHGSMTVTPATVKVFLFSDKIRFELPLFSIRFYRNLIIKDNFLAALVKGEVNAHSEF